MLVTQKTVGESTAPIRMKAPNTWRYLQQHSDVLDGRRSSIYRNRPRFAVFGVGEYAFSGWKVAISGMYKQLRFVAVGPYQGRPVVFDDTCYFIPCRAQDEARFVADLLNSEPAQQFYRSLIFWDDKRPITARALRSLSLLNLAHELQQDRQLLTYAKRPQRNDAEPAPTSAPAPAKPETFISQTGPAELPAGTHVGARTCNQPYGIYHPYPD